MTEEVQHKRYASGFVRIHDARTSTAGVPGSLAAHREQRSGRFLLLLFQGDHPPARGDRKEEEKAPANFAWCRVWEAARTVTSTSPVVTRRLPGRGGHLAPGYASQSASDLLAVYGPERVGIPGTTSRTYAGGRGRGELRLTPARPGRAARQEERPARVAPARSPSRIKTASSPAPDTGGALRVPARSVSARSTKPRMCCGTGTTRQAARTAATALLPTSRKPRPCRAPHVGRSAAPSRAGDTYPQFSGDTPEDHTLKKPDFW